MGTMTRRGTTRQSAAARAAAVLVLGALTVCAACGPTQASGASTTTDPGAAATNPRTPSAAGELAGVPAEYRATYRQLVSNLADLQQQDSAGAVDGPVGQTTMAGALEVADGNRGLGLLEPSTMSTVTATLDEFQSLHMTGVMLEVGYPMLLPTFPNSAAYLSFYEQVANQVHARSMTLLIELNPIFPNPQISSLHPDYAGLTVATYAAQQAEEAQIIVDDFHPTYLTLLDEPSTFAANLGLPIATPAGAVEVLGDELPGIDRGTTLLGAGIGTWENPAIERAIAMTGVNYLSVHVYPTGTRQIAALDQVTQIAAAAHKPLVEDETWLSKSNPDGRPGAGNAVVEQKIKDWSFWAPLDGQFLAAMTTYARDHGFAFVSPFSTDLFAGYLAWTPARDALTKGQVDRLAARVQLANLATGTLSSTAVAYRQAIDG